MLRRFVVWVATFGLAIGVAVPTATVSAAAPAVALSSTVIDFGSAAWLQAAPTQNLIVTNTGDALLSVQTIDISGQP